MYVLVTSRLTKVGASTDALVMKLRPSVQVRQKMQNANEPGPPEGWITFVFAELKPAPHTYLRCG